MTREDIKQLMIDYPFQTFNIELETVLYMSIYHYNGNRYIEAWFDKDNPNVVTNLFVTLYSNKFLRKIDLCKQVHTIEQLKKELSLE